MDSVRLPNGSATVETYLHHELVDPLPLSFTAPRGFVPGQQTTLAPPETFGLTFDRSGLLDIARRHGVDADCLQAIGFVTKLSRHKPDPRQRPITLRLSAVHDAMFCLDDPGRYRLVMMLFNGSSLPPAWYGRIAGLAGTAEIHRCLPDVLARPGRPDVEPLLQHVGHPPGLHMLPPAFDMTLDLKVRRTPLPLPDWLHQPAATAAHTVAALPADALRGYHRLRQIVGK